MTDLRRALALLELPRRRVAVAVVAGVATLGSALALSALSAWLITRAWQMPPVLHLTVAVVAVRALGITRGICRYLERLSTHDVALRGTVALRENLYTALAQGDSAATMSIRRGDLVARTGADVDAVGEVVVRAIVPIAVASILSVAAVGLVAVWSPAAAAATAVALIVSGVLAPWLTARAETTASVELVHARADHTGHVVTAIDHAAELRVAGRLAEVRRRADAADAAAADAQDRGAVFSALSAAATPLAVGIAVIAALVVGIEAYGTGSGFAGGTDPTGLAIVVLVPFAAFEATATLPAAALALVRASAAARRILALVDAARVTRPTGSAEPDAVTALRVQSLVAGRGRAETAPVTFTVSRGDRIAITGASGVGKTTLALTLAGLVPPVSGTVLVSAGSVSAGSVSAGSGSGNLTVCDVAPSVLRRHISYTAEDAHVFETTLFENLRVVRGDVTEEQARDVLDAVGLTDWMRTLPEGLHTELIAGAGALSGGQRRRLLLARAILSRADVLVIDEPTEHLDSPEAETMLRRLLDPHGGLVDPDVAVVAITHRDVPDGVRTVHVRAAEKDVAECGGPRVASWVHERGGGLELNDSWTREVAAR